MRIISTQHITNRNIVKKCGEIPEKDLRNIHNKNVRIFEKYLRGKSSSKCHISEDTCLKVIGININTKIWKPMT